MATRLGILGGSFDPVHLGHLLLAEYCREACRLDEVWFLPAATAPHKPQQPQSTSERRLEMLRLAVGGHEGFVVSDREIQRGGVSYTVDTLAAIHEQRPADALFLLMGADSLADLPNWKEPARICALALPAVVRRQGAPEPDLGCLSGLMPPERLTAARACLVAMPLVELSSREIRRRVAAGQSIRYQTPRAVEKYIETHDLYRSATTT